MMYCMWSTLSFGPRHFWPTMPAFAPIQWQETMRKECAFDSDTSTSPRMFFLWLKACFFAFRIVCRDFWNRNTYACPYSTFWKVAEVLQFFLVPWYWLLISMIHSSLDVFLRCSVSVLCKARCRMVLELRRSLAFWLKLVAFACERGSKWLDRSNCSSYILIL